MKENQSVHAAPESAGKIRLVLFLGVSAGILAAAFFLLFRPNPPTTFDVFYFAARQSLDGQIDYNTGYGLWTYTPAALFYFLPYAIALDYDSAALLHRVLSVFVTLLFSLGIVDLLSDRVDITRSDQLLVFGFCSLSVYPVVNVVNGSFVGIFGAMLGVGWLLMEDDRDIGGAFWALAAIVKGYPAFWGVYMIRVRRWRAVRTAIVAGAGSSLAALALFGIDGYVRFFTVAGSSRVRYEMFRGGMSPDNEAVTPLRGLSQLFPGVDPAVWTPLLFLTVICITVFVYYSVPDSTFVGRATLLLATIIGVWMVMPTSQDLDIYILYAPLLMLLYTEPRVRIQNMYLLGTVLLSFNFGRGELLTVTQFLGISEQIMWFADPVLRFASMPMYGLLVLYAGCVWKGYHCYKAEEYPDSEQPGQMDTA